MIQSDTEQAGLGLRSPGQGDAAPVLDLQPFCGTDEARPYLMKPFSRDGFTWATNGHILVRVTLRPELPNVEKKFNIAGPLQDFESASFFKPEYVLPARSAMPVECTVCEGRGYEHDCPNCGCICGTCDGKGEADPERSMSASIGPTPFSLNYIRQMLSLPDVEIETVPSGRSEKPLFFRFNGGVGAIMPLRTVRLNHVDISPTETVIANQAQTAPLPD